MRPQDSLAEYRKKRDFDRTQEPRGKTGEESGKGPIFVIQKHAASSLHYDFRLEIGGVLVSWAIPKGPSLDPREKRLAVRTEDHPLEYAHFEGNIPEGEYGAGSVVVWDTGTFRNLAEKDGREIPAEEALENGHLSFWLEGKRLQGGFALTKFGEGNKWLLVKRRNKKPLEVVGEEKTHGK